MDSLLKGRGNLVNGQKNILNVENSAPKTFVNNLRLNLSRSRRCEQVILLKSFAGKRSQTGYPHIDRPYYEDYEIYIFIYNMARPRPAPEGCRNM